MQRWDRTYWAVQGALLAATFVLMIRTFPDLPEWKLFLWYFAATIVWWAVHLLGQCWLQARDFEKHIKPRINDITKGH
jgi:hypothetical protein